MLKNYKARYNWHITNGPEEIAKILKGDDEEA